MIYRFFHIPALTPEEAEQQLNQFCAGQRVASIEKQFVQDGERSFWAICVCYQAGGQQALPGGGGTKPPKVDYREVLNEQDFAVYAKLRNLRKELADGSGIPAYGIFTNEQLAKMVQQRTTSLTALAEIEGVGLARVEKYGAVFVELLQANLAALGVVSSLTRKTSGD